jgi:hypothetical protein
MKSHSADLRAGNKHNLIVVPAFTFMGRGDSMCQDVELC